MVDPFLHIIAQQGPGQSLESNFCNRSPFSPLVLPCVHHCLPKHLGWFLNYESNTWSNQRGRCALFGSYTKNQQGVPIHQNRVKHESRFQIWLCNSVPENYCRSPKKIHRLFSCLYNSISNFNEEFFWKPWLSPNTPAPNDDLTVVTGFWDHRIGGGTRQRRRSLQHTESWMEVVLSHLKGKYILYNLELPPTQ